MVPGRCVWSLFINYKSKIVFMNWWGCAALADQKKGSVIFGLGLVGNGYN